MYDLETGFLCTRPSAIISADRFVTNFTLMSAALQLKELGRSCLRLPTLLLLHISLHRPTHKECVLCTLPQPFQAVIEQRLVFTVHCLLRAWKQVPGIQVLSLYP
jgi:hypothetical protein